MFCARALGNVKMKTVEMVNLGFIGGCSLCVYSQKNMEIAYMMRLPTTSDIGAKTKGPTPNPTTKSDMERKITSLETSRVRAGPRKLFERADDR